MMQPKDREGAQCHHGIVGYAASALTETLANKQEQQKLLRRKSVIFIALALALLMGYMNDVFVDRAGLSDIEEYSSPRMLSAEEEYADDAGDDGPTFVFIVGLEGTGHHLISALLEQSPNMIKMEELGVCSTDDDAGSIEHRGEFYSLSSQFFSTGWERYSGLFDPKQYAGERYKRILDDLKTIRRKFNEQEGQQNDNDAPFHIAINANSCAGPSMISYPNVLGSDRSVQNFNLDVFYNACTDANVKCKHVYLYRNPYDILKSTTKNRRYNSNEYDSIRFYTSVLQQIHSQLMSFPEKNMGCFGFLDAEGHELQQDWERFGSLWGWESFDDFMAAANEIDTMSPVPMSEGMKAGLVPARLMVLMRALEGIHNRVRDSCYSTLNSVEDETLAMIEPNEIVLEEEVPGAVAPDEVAGSRFVPPTSPIT